MNLQAYADCDSYDRYRRTTDLMLESVHVVQLGELSNGGVLLAMGIAKFIGCWAS